LGNLILTTVTQSTLRSQIDPPFTSDGSTGTPIDVSPPHTPTRRNTMFPGISVCVLSTDPDLVADTVAMYEAHMATVHVATSFAEYARLQDEGVVLEVLNN
jgi:hypothetical protein